MVKEVKYQLIKKFDKVEIRLYNNLIIAKVDGYGDSGFNFLFVNQMFVFPVPE